MTGGRSPQRLLAARLRLAGAALAWERGWPAAWPALGLIGGFAVLALFDLLPLLPAPIHAGVLAAFGFGVLAAVIWGYGNFAWPNGDAARRRLELSSGLPHRPLQALSDTPSGPPDPATAQLWEAHRARVAAAVRRLRVGWPHAGLAPWDPWGLRSILAILLLLAALDAGADWRDRIVRAFEPGFAPGVAAAASFDLWITPPDYTGLPPQFLRAGTKGTIRVPTGSTLLAQVHGGDALPRLVIDRADHDFSAVDKEDFRFGTTLSAGTRLTLTQGWTTLGSWPIQIIPDHPPTVAFARPPSATPRAALRLDYRASDDYGVEGVKAVIRRADDDQKGAPAIALDLPLPGLHLKQATATSYHDLSAHPWAGLPVVVRLVARDALGQTGSTPPVRMTLPERHFTNLIARALIDQRKELVKDPVGARIPVAEILGDLNQRPALYRNDGTVSLALSFAQYELRRDPGPAAAATVIGLLWDTALHIEDGNMPLAERDLRRIEQRLQDALAKGAPDDQIAALMQQLRQALDRYMQALAENLQRHPDQAMAPVAPGRMLSSRDLQRMLDQAENLARNGDRDQARQLLSQLQNMLENLRMARPGEMQPGGSGGAQQMMQSLEELMRRQQGLLDRSFQAQRQGGEHNPTNRPGGPQDAMPPMGGLGAAAGQQEALRRMLGDLMRRLGEGSGEIPQPLGRAERAMHDATGALQQGEAGAAIGPQTEALDQLQQGAREIARQLQQRLGNAWGLRGKGSTASQRPAEWDMRDPFGRPSGDGLYDEGDVKIPDTGTMQKSRQILDELRRRAGERSRPAIELDYIDRLLKRF